MDEQAEIDKLKAHLAKMVEFNAIDGARIEGLQDKLEEAKAEIERLKNEPSLMGDYNRLEKAFKAERLHSDELAGVLEVIAESKEKTLLGKCCVDDTCQRYFDDETTSRCSFAFGVNKGFRENAKKAEQALDAHRKHREERSET